MEPTTNWPAIIGIILTGTAMIVGAGVAYITLFVKGKVAESKEEIMEHIDSKFALKELMTARFDAIEKSFEVQFKALDTRLSALERSK